jgi:hypothetical protein
MLLIAPHIILSCGTGGPSRLVTSIWTIGMNWQILIGSERRNGCPPLRVIFDIEKVALEITGSAEFEIEKL